MKKNVFYFLVIISLMFIKINSVSAVSPTPTFPNYAKFTRGVTNTCYWVDSTMTSFIPYINKAADVWEDEPTNIKNTAVASNGATHIDFYGYKSNSSLDPGSKVVAYTTFWGPKGATISTDLEGRPLEDYKFTRIYTNTSMSESKNAIVFEHEMGHAYGLDHYNSYPKSIMYPALDKMEATEPTSVDVRAINILYP